MDNIGFKMDQTKQRLARMNEKLFNRAYIDLPEDETTFESTINYVIGLKSKLKSQFHSLKMEFECKRSAFLGSFWELYPAENLGCSSEVQQKEFSFAADNCDTILEEIYQLGLEEFGAALRAKHSANNKKYDLKLEINKDSSLRS